MRHTGTPPSSELVARARGLAANGARALLGITGAPGAGKSTLAAEIVAALGDNAMLVPMDGFHLTNRELIRLGRRDRKGAPDTFDVAGYVALLRRLRNSREVVRAPTFRRDIDEPLADAITIGPEVSLVVTEGNYILLDGPWATARDCLDEVWYVDLDDRTRVERLVDRHVRFGMTREQAVSWVRDVDEANGRLIASTRGSADLVVTRGA